MKKKSSTKSTAKKQRKVESKSSSTSQPSFASKPNEPFVPQCSFWDLIARGGKTTGMRHGILRQLQGREDLEKTLDPHLPPHLVAAVQEFAFGACDDDDDEEEEDDEDEAVDEGSDVEIDLEQE